jgi:hypothetical protein
LRTSKLFEKVGSVFISSTQIGPHPEIYLGGEVAELSYAIHCPFAQFIEKSSDSDMNITNK